MKEDKELSELSKRFIEILQSKKYSAYKLEKEVPEITSAKISHIKTGRNQPSKDIINALLEKFTDINEVWLLTGQGPMTTNEIKQTPTTNNAHEKLRPSVSRTSPNLSLTKSNYMDKIKQLLNQDKDDPVNITSVYNVHLTTGKVSTLESGSKIPDLLLLNGAFKDCDLVIRHTDPAMHGFFETESFIGVKKITEESYRRRIIPGKVYVVVMEDYILERFLYPGTEKAFLLRAENPRQDHDFEIDYEEVIELYLIKGWVQAPKLKST